MLKLSVDDGCASDVRVAELAKKYGVETIFYWPVEWRSLAYSNGYEPLNLIEAKSIAGQFEVGSHTVTHRHLTKLDDTDAMIEIFDSQAILQKLFDQPIKRFCPPRGYTNNTLTAYTALFYESQRLTKGIGLVHIHPNSGANGNLAWQDYYRLCLERGEDIELWGHSHEFDRFNLWDEIEQFFKELK